jgi:ligand-binding sensor domain-containing protein
LLPILAQQKQIRFDHLTVEDGLSQSTVFSIAQDSTGFMWFATEDGLNRYDGYTCTVFRNNPQDSNSISDIGIRKLYVDRSGHLWIITLSGKLDRFDPEKQFFIHYKFYANTDLNTSLIRVSSISEDNQGTLWIGSTKGLLYKYNSKEDKFNIYKLKTENQFPENIHLQCFYIDEAGLIWMGTWQGLINIDLSSENLIHFKHIPESKNTIGGNMIYDISEDAEGRIWIASVNGGVTSFNKPTNSFETYRFKSDNENGISSDRIMSIFCDSKSNIWIGTIDRGVDLFDFDKNSFQHYRHVPSARSSIGNGAIFSIFEDLGGNIWFGTSSGGVSKYDRKRQHFSQITHDASDPGSLSSNVVLSICEDNWGAFWIGTDGGGLNMRPLGESIFKNYFQNPGEIGSNSITSIYEDRSGTIWLGTDPGVNASAGKVFIYSRSTNSFKYINKIQIKVGGVTTFAEDSYGIIWIGTAADGLRSYSPTKNLVKEYKHDKNDSSSISGTSVFTIFEDSRGDLWIGTIAKGLNKFIRKNETFKRFVNDPNNPETVSNNSIWTIAEDSNGSLWMGTWGGGLNQFDPESETFKHFTVNDGLPSNIIYSILPDNSDNLWISTSRGITNFNTITFDVKNYDDSYGLHNLEFNQGAFCKGNDGSFYFGGTNGVTSFHPEQIKPNDIAPPIVLTNFRVFDEKILLEKSINYLSEIILSYQQNFFSFEFAALDFTAPEKNQYTYLLEGVDKYWVYAGNRRYASYTDISPGEYIFRVKGSNNDGVWSEQEASIAIIITPPFWQTWWFRIISLAFIAGLLYAFYKYRLNKLLEVERTRVRIARDLHDDVSATITGMVYFSDAIEKEVGEKKTPMLQKLISLIHESATNVQESMSDIIWSINPENDKWEIILPKFRRYASDLCESKEITYEIDIPESMQVKPLEMESRRNLWLVFKEMVTNAVKHSNCKELKINIEIIDSHLQLFVSDNGKGFDPQNQSEGNGVKNIQTRAKTLNGNIKLKSTPGSGTSWELNMPL